MADSDWTTQTLFVFFQQRFADSDKALQAALSSAKEAVSKAEVAATKRFESVNEFRQTLSDQTATFITREAAEAHIEAIRNESRAECHRLEDKIEQLTRERRATAVALLLLGAGVVANIMANFVFGQ